MPATSTFATNASPQKIIVSPANVRSNAPGVVVKSAEYVWPVTYTLPAGSSATSLPTSVSEPPRKLANRRVEPVASSFAT